MNQFRRASTTVDLPAWVTEGSTFSSVVVMSFKRLFMLEANFYSRVVSHILRRHGDIYLLVSFYKVPDLLAGIIGLLL